jgi:hypothetical protein
VLWAETYGCDGLIAAEIGFYVLVLCVLASLTRQRDILIVLIMYARTYRFINGKDFVDTVSVRFIAVYELCTFPQLLLRWPFN